MFKITSATKGVEALCETNHGVAYFNTLLGTDDCVIEDYIPPAPPPLEELILVYVCSPWQIRKALNQLGLRQAVEDAVAGSNDIAMKDGWEFATSFASNNPFVIGIGTALGKTQDDIVEIIKFAGTL